jgi:D-psicose/D-tagatose/L-ribulose 3-epimerase
VPWQDVATALSDIGYDGPVVIGVLHAQGQEHRTRGSGAWRSFAPSSDALATDGLAFLKQLFAH